MRFLELRLIAFGGFDNVTLDFSAPGLHVIHGRNEAGKSTTLRALTHLLYGIPERTIDAYKFPMPSLRIGARLEGDGGEVLDVVRRKARTKSLLDRAEQPIDDAPLLKMLHGVSAEMYGTSFGMTHATLQQGARALLDGKGDLGESLFQAGIGGGELHKLLVSLGAEAERIWSPLARNKPLNEAMRVIADAKKATLDKSASHESYTSQIAEIERQKERKAAAAAERSALLVEQKRLQRLKGMLPLFAKRAELARRRDELAGVVLLPEDAPRDRAEALRAQGDTEVTIARLHAEVADLTARREALKAPDGLADAASELSGLQGELALFAKNEQDLPRAQAELAAEEAEAAKLARAIAGEGASPAALRADARAIGRVRNLTSEPKRIQALIRSAERARDDARAELLARTTAAPADTDRSKGLEERLVRRQKALGEMTGDLAAFVALPLPSRATIERHERELAALADDVRRAAERRLVLEREVADTAREVDALQGAAAVPTEADLAAARTRRDGLWATLRAAFDDVTARAYELAVAAADDVADRLRREAERVARLAKLLATQRAAATELANAAAAQAALDARASEVARAWSAEWAPAGITPRTPAEMRAWLEAHGKLTETFEELADARADARRAHDAERERLGRAADQHERERAAHMKELDAWREEWKAAVEKLGLPGELGVEDGIAVVDELGALARRVETADSHRARVTAATAENARIALWVKGLATRLAPDLASLPTQEAGRDLVRRFDLARQERAQRIELDAQLDGKRAALAEESARHEASVKRLAALMATAGVASMDALVAAEERSRAARTLAAEEAHHHEVLLAKADGAPLAELSAEAAVTRADAVDARLDEIEERLPQVDDELNEAVVKIVQAEGGLAELDRGDDAAAAAAEVQGAVARARQLAERWARVRLAEAVLSREIQRYRDQNQGPILGRASEVFQRLTRGAYNGLRAGLDDDGERPILLAVKDTGDVPTNLLSDGARDQVYLALRVASLERHAAAAGPLPLVVDDILIQFDDERARAALEVLAGLSATVQVIFFTHHQRLVDLARATCGAELTVHELGRPPVTGSQLSLTS